jgi:hypothetical protein
VTRVGLATLAIVLVLGALAVFMARAFGASGSRAAAVVSVVSQWLTAWVLWTFAGGLALQTGLLRVYEPAVFAAVAVVGAFAHYRLLAAGQRDRARAMFVGSQLAWLVVLLVWNGALW